MAQNVSEGELEWSSSEDSYSVRQIHEQIGLPVLVYVQEGIYSTVESTTFSGGDYLKLHGCETLEKVVAYPTLGNEEKFSAYYKNWHKPLEIPLDYRIKARVIPKHGHKRIYPEVRMLIEDFPRFVKTGRNISGRDENRSIVLIPAGSILELLRITNDVVQRLVCSHKCQEISFSMDCQGRFSISPDTKTYTIREIVKKLPLPQLIELEDDGVGVAKYLSGEAKKALSNLEMFKGNFILDKVVQEDVVYGTHRLEFTKFHNKAGPNRLQAIVVISLDSDATFQVALNRESSTYTTVFTHNYIKTIKTAKLVPTFIGVQGETNRTIQMPVEEEEEVEETGSRLRSPQPAVAPRNHKPRVKPIDKPLNTREKGSMDGSDSDDSVGDYEPVTPDLTGSTGGGAKARRTRLVSRYEICEPDLSTPDQDLPTPNQPPPRPQRPERSERINKESIKLPQAPAKRTTTERVQVTVHKTLTRAKEGVKQARQVLKGAIQRSPKDKPSTSVIISSPVVEGSVNPFIPVIQEEESNESSDDDNPTYDYPDAGRLEFNFPAPTTDVTVKNKSSLDRRKLPNPPPSTAIPLASSPNTQHTNLKAADTHSINANVVKPTGGIMPVKPVLSVKAFQQVNAIQKVKAIHTDRDIQPIRLTPQGIPDRPTTHEAQKQTPPPTAPKPSASRTAGANVRLTKMNSISREEMKYFSVEELFEWLKKLGLGEKVNLFFDRMVDGDLFLQMEMETFKTEFNLTDTEFMNLKRFQKEGKIPKTSHA